MNSPSRPIIIIIIIMSSSSSSSSSNSIIMELPKCFFRLLRTKLFVHGAAPTHAACFTKLNLLVLMIAAVVEKGILDTAILCRFEAVGHMGACLLVASNFS